MKPVCRDAIGNLSKNTVRDHELEWSMEEPASDVPVREEKFKPRKNQDAAGTEKRVEKVLMLFRHLGGLNVRITFEQSFKAVGGQLFENRFLLGIARQEMNGDPDEQIALICDRIGMPQNLLASFRRALPDANHVYFGVEKSEQTLLFKTYLEFRDRIEKEIDGACVTGQCFRLFTGFKWDTSSLGRQAVARYAWYPSLPVPEMLERLQMLIGPGRHGGLFEVVQGVTRGASEKIAHSDIQYLEVTEEGNPRRSFDINIYKSGLRIEDLSPYLLQALRRCAIPSGSIESLYQRIKTEKFGHLAGGVDRENNEFMTVYHGVKQVHSSQLGSARVAPGDRPHHGG